MSELVYDKANNRYVAVLKNMNEEDVRVYVYVGYNGFGIGVEGYGNLDQDLDGADIAWLDVFYKDCEDKQYGNDVILRVRDNINDDNDRSISINMEEARLENLEDSND